MECTRSKLQTAYRFYLSSKKLIWIFCWSAYIHKPMLTVYHNYTQHSCCNLYQLTGTFSLDLLKKSAPSRIVNLTSIAHRWGSVQFDNLNSERSFKTGRAYFDSKLEVVLFTRELARRLQSTGRRNVNYVFRHAHVLPYCVLQAFMLNVIYT